MTLALKDHIFFKVADPTARDVNGNVVFKFSNQKGANKVMIMNDINDNVLYQFDEATSRGLNKAVIRNGQGQELIRIDTMYSATSKFRISFQNVVTGQGVSLSVQGKLWVGLQCQLVMDNGQVVAHIIRDKTKALLLTQEKATYTLSVAPGVDLALITIVVAALNQIDQSRAMNFRCDETRPVCATCVRLGIDCLGYEGPSKPAWIRRKDVVTDVSRRIRKAVADTRSARMNQHWSAKAAERARQMAHRVEGSGAVVADDGPATIGMEDGFAALGGAAEPMALGSPVRLLSPPLPGSNNADLIQDLAELLPHPIDMAVPLPGVESDLDHELISLLGLDHSSLAMTLNPNPSYYPLLTQPSTTYGLSIPTPSHDMRYFDHYLKVILPFQYPFDRKVMVDLIAPLAFTNSVVFASVTSMAALHMGSKRRRRRPGTSLEAPMTDTDVQFAETSLRHNVSQIKTMPLARFDTHEMIVATMAVTSFHLFDGGNRNGWRESVELCRRCLASSLRGQGFPLIWTDILTSVTEGVSSKFLPLYRTLLLDGHTEKAKGRLLKETVMGCDSTTRLAMAETISLSEWKHEAARMGQLSLRSLLAHASGVERLLDERSWRERHLFEATDLGGLQRKAMSDVFYHAARVLLATVVNGCFPGVAAAVRDTVTALTALESLGVEGAERALVFPAVIAGTHAQTPQQRQFFLDRFNPLGDDAEFGNTQNGLRLIKEVWRQRDGGAPGAEVCWRTVMFELDDEGLLLI
ncbi:hypothetical protein Q8F55_003278 [Vanrija albida]|uniref:Zn(2)-C6 fungal-type domain-containing protein n=1 Tax=Vanrija albida TaxID=181172 RepID=A0ABR3Q3J1_9TREE